MGLKFLPLLFFASGCLAFDGPERLERDLCFIQQWECSPCRNFPVSYNNVLEGGYILMPNSRMGDPGELAFGFASTPPYYNWNLRCEFLPRFEVSGSYRVFRGVDDPLLSPHGFGDFSDKGLNLKFAPFLPEDSDYRLPGIAIGWNDCLGTKSFQSKYVVLTQVLPALNLEGSFGYGWERIRGLLGGVAFYPFRNWGGMWLEGLSLTAEYDAIHYDCDPHPHGRDQRSKINYGLKYRYLDAIDLTFAEVRGKKFSFAASAFYNFGCTEGFVPKIDDPLPYSCPKNFEEVGPYRPMDLFLHEIVQAFCTQGFYVERIITYYDSCQLKTLKITVENEKYWQECEVRNRLTSILTALLPDDVDQVYVVQTVLGMPIQEYRFFGEYLRGHLQDNISDYELALISPLEEVSCNDTLAPRVLYSRDLPWLEPALLPRFHSYFGSSRGKFKYGAGITAEFDGQVPWCNINYRLQLGYLLFSYLKTASDVDILNPSQLINVHTQIITYEKQRGVLVDEFYLQKNMAIGGGHYSRLSAGYFNPMYIGLDFEYIYYPVCSPFAIGFDAAVVRRRTFNGLGWTNNIRKLNGYIPTYVPFLGTQAFVDLYYDWRATDLAFEVNLGKFLARDWGARFQVARQFPSGLKLFFWYTWTNGNDHLNGSIYYDKGIGLSMPLDVFMTCSSKTRFGFEMSAWLRDVGYRTPAGDRLYDLIYYERQ